MNGGHYQTDVIEAEQLIVRRVVRSGHSDQYVFAEIPDELLTRRQMIILLNKALSVPIVEIAFAMEEFAHNPNYTQVYFGMLNRAFLFAK